MADDVRMKAMSNLSNIMREDKRLENLTKSTQGAGKIKAKKEAQKKLLEEFEARMLAQPELNAYALPKRTDGGPDENGKRTYEKDDFVSGDSEAQRKRAIDLLRMKQNDPYFKDNPVAKAVKKAFNSKK